MTDTTTRSSSPHNHTPIELQIFPLNTHGTLTAVKQEWYDAGRADAFAEAYTGAADDSGDVDTVPTDGQWLTRLFALPRDQRLVVASYYAAAASTARTCFIEAHQARIAVLAAELTEARERLAEAVHDAAARGYEACVEDVGHHNPDLAKWLHDQNPCEPFTPAPRQDRDYFEETGDDTL